MGARQSNAGKDDFPNPSDQSATKRNHEKRTDRSFYEANHSESSLKRLLRAAHDHQADVKNRRANKRSDDDKEGCQNQEENPAETAQKMCKRAVPVAEGGKRSEDKIVNHGKRHAESSAKDGIEKRLAETALALHRGERGDRSTQNHLQSFNKRVEQSFRLALVPWQSAARHGRFRDW